MIFLILITTKVMAVALAYYGVPVLMKGSFGSSSSLSSIPSPASCIPAFWRTRCGYLIPDAPPELLADAVLSVVHDASFCKALSWSGKSCCGSNLMRKQDA